MDEKVLESGFMYESIKKMIKYNIMLKTIVYFLGKFSGDKTKY